MQVYTCNVQEWVRARCAMHAVCKPVQFRHVCARSPLYAHRAAQQRTYTHMHRHQAQDLIPEPALYPVQSHATRGLYTLNDENKRQPPQQPIQRNVVHPRIGCCHGFAIVIRQNLSVASIARNYRLEAMGMDVNLYRRRYHPSVKRKVPIDIGQRP